MKINVYGESKGCVVFFKPLSEPLLMNEICERCPGVKIIEKSKTAIALSVDNYNDIVEHVRRTGFVFLQHVHPYLLTCPLTGDENDLGEIIKMLDKIESYLEHSDVITCQCKIVTDKRMALSGSSITDSVASYLTEKGFNISPDDAAVAVSVTLLENRAYAGVSLISDNVSDWAGGVLFYSKSEDIMCRAEFKIEEAFKDFKIKVKEGMRALDLGAAPGGWTHFLSKMNISVDAVDPADLDEKVLSCHNVEHYKITAQEFMRSYPDKEYDIIVNDMKMDTNESVDIVCEISDRLKENGFCILTLKLPKSKVQKRINSARKALSSKFEVIRIRQLYYNRSEVTVYMKYKPFNNLDK